MSCFKVNLMQIKVNKRLRCKLVLHKISWYIFIAMFVLLANWHANLLSIYYRKKKTSLIIAILDFSVKDAIIITRLYNSVMGLSVMRYIWF